MTYSLSCMQTDHGRFWNFHSFFFFKDTHFLYKLEFELDRAFYKTRMPSCHFHWTMQSTRSKQIHVVPIQTRATRKWFATYAFIVCQFKFSHVHFCFMQHLMSDLGWPQTQNTRVQKCESRNQSFAIGFWSTVVGFNLYNLQLRIILLLKQLIHSVIS